MTNHIELGNEQFARSRELCKLITLGEVTLAGNKKLKIYGRLNCSSGKRMKTQNRVFFKNEDEAVMYSYRPCGNCMPAEYEIWKTNNGTI